METTHTPGGWFMHREGFSTIYVESRIGGGMVQEVAACGPTSEGSEQQEANARLISAAPELLEALKEILIDMKLAQSYMRSASKFDLSWDGWADAIQPSVDAAIAAISKATGAKQ